jgi:type II secretion system protein N
MAARKRAIFLLYVLYGCVLTGVLLVVRFPAQTLRHSCAGVVERIIPGTTCVIGGIDYDFPLTLRIQDIRVTRLHSPEDIFFSAKRLSMRLDLQHAGVHLLMEAYDGQHECRLRIKGEALTLVDVQIQHLDLGQWGALHRLLGRKFSGFLDITGEYSGRLSKLMAGEAKGIAVVREGSIELLQPILSLNAINLQNVVMEIYLQNKVVTMRKGSFHGAEFKGTVSGTFGVNVPMGSSMLMLSGDLTPLLLANVDPQWKNRVTILLKRNKQSTLPFVISGTLAGPLFRFGG